MKSLFLQKKNINKILLIILFVIFIFLPVFFKNPYVIHLVIVSLMWGICAASWDLVFGYMGIFHFAQTAFLGVGAYASGLLCIAFSISPWWGVLWSGIMSGLLSLALSLPTLRLKETYMTLVSLGFVFAIFYVASSWTSFTKGENGLWGIPSLYAAVSKTSFYYTILGLFIFSMAVLYGIVKSRYGLALIAIKGSEDSSKSLGINVTKVKIFIFLISAVLTGVAGWFYAHYILLVTPEIFKMEAMISVMAMTVIGGTGSLAGPVIGSFLITWLLEYFRIVGEFRFIIYAAALFFIMLLRPKGIYGGIQGLLDHLRR